MKHITLVLLAAFFLASCTHKTETKEDKLVQLKKDRGALDEKIRKLEVGRQDSVKATPVSVMPVELQEFNAYIEVQSQVTGDENVNATPQVPGTIRNVLVHAGQRVSRGQVLATMDAAAIEQQIAAQDAQLSFARTVYEKQQKLWAQNIGTEVQLLQAKANYQSQERSRASAVAQRNMYRIISPISGVVDQVNVKVGDAAGPGMPYGIHVVSPDKLKAEANLGENYLGKVKIGDPVFLVFPDINDSIRTRLTYVAQAIDPVSRSFVAQVRLGNNNRLHPNMSCRMKIANYRNSSVIVVPISLIQNTSGGDLLYVADAGKAKAVPVKTGRSSNGMIEVLSGLAQGDKVITEGYQDLDNGTPIVIQ